MFLGAGSVMHGMNDQVDMRRFGGAAHGHADHLRHVRAAATSPSSASRRSPGSSPRTRSSRRRSTRAARLAAVGLRHRRAARRRHHRVLHDPAVRHDLLRRAALGPRTCTRTSRRRSMTVPMIVLAVGSVGARRCLLGSTAAIAGLAGARRRARRRGAHPVLPVARCSASVTLVARRRRRRAGLARCTGASRCRSSRRSGRSLTARRAQRPLPRRLQRGACFMRPGQYLTRFAGLLRQPRRRRRRQRRSPRDRRHVRPAAPAADRLRPLLRPVDARRAPPSWSAPAAGEALT